MKKETFLEHLKPFINTDCGSYQPAGVGKIADMLTEKYTALGGWHIKRQHLHDEVGPALLITKRENPDHYDVLLGGHVDVKIRIKLGQAPHLNLCAEVPFQVVEN